MTKTPSTKIGPLSQRNWESFPPLPFGLKVFSSMVPGLTQFLLPFVSLDVLLQHINLIIGQHKLIRESLAFFFLKLEGLILSRNP